MTIRRRNLLLLTLSLILLATTPVAAQAPNPGFQSGWQPNSYRFACESSGACNLDAATRRDVTTLLSQAVGDVQATPFKAPTWWAPRKAAAPGGEEFIELYESGSGNVAFVSCQSLKENGPIVRAIMTIGNRFAYFRENDAEYWNYNFVSHEVFHLSQYEYPFWDMTRCGGVPGWIMESTATAVAGHMMRKRYPSVWPSRRNRLEARDMAGLRRYDISMPQRFENSDGEIWSGSPVYQRTSSFWRHLAEVHHGGKMDFLHRYMSHTSSGDDWTQWLRDNVQAVTGGPLGMVFAGFLADFAGWGDRNFPGELFGRKDWLKEAFGGCEQVYLNKAEPADYVELDLEPIAGDCVEVAVAAMGPDGVAAGESAAVQIAAMIMSGHASARNGVHLALAASNDKENFHCAREAKRSGKRGIGKCLWVPDDGQIRLGGGPVEARVWNVFAQEKGEGEGRPKKPGGETEARHEPGDGKGELKNLYTVSYTPTVESMKEPDFNPDEPISIRLYFVLDVAKIEVEGQPKKGAIGTMGNPSADPQTTLPKRDKGGTVVNSYSKPDRYQSPIPVSTPVPAEVEGKLAYFASASSSGVMLILWPLRANAQGKLEGYPLSVGETGTYSLGIQAHIGGEPAAGLPGASLVVEEFTDLVFRARYNGMLCRHRDVIPVRPGQPVENPCRDPFAVGGRIVKAFAGSRLPGRYMVVERTEGTEMYRKAAERGIYEWIEGAPAGGEEGPGAPPPGDSAGTGGTVEECACTCEERAESERRGMEMKRRMEAGEDVSPGALMGLMRCVTPCRAEYAVCAMQEEEARQAQEEEAAARARQALKDSDACDCSCEGIQTMQGRTESILQAMQDGSPTAMSDLQRLGECMSACNEELSKCAGRP